jgi:translation initiation factor 2B subunit (eIF-2B alpha/beta/delta family)
VFLGTHGVLKSRDFLCSVGSYILAATAKQFNAEVIAFAETTKFLINGEGDDVASHEKIFSSEQMWKRHPVLINTICLTPKMDCVPKKLVDLVVTEQGIFKPEDIPHPAEQPTGEMASKKKVSKAT